MAELSFHSTLSMQSGTAIPLLGFGVWQLEPGHETEGAVLKALEVGYRHIDTATLYNNEVSVGAAIQKSGIPREEIFITTKLWPTDAFDVTRALTNSLQKLGCAYVDLYLLHWPIPFLGQRTWAQMEAEQKNGFAKAIGVSNYTHIQLAELLHDATIPPSVNQIEFNPYVYQKELLEYCISKNIVVEAYSPLTRGLHLDNVALAKIAKTYGKTVAQVMLRWGLQKGVVVLPKSVHPKRIEENANIFDFALQPLDMERIDSLSR